MATHCELNSLVGKLPHAGTQPANYGLGADLAFLMAGYLLGIPLASPRYLLRISSAPSLLKMPSGSRITIVIEAARRTLWLRVLRLHARKHEGNSGRKGAGQDAGAPPEPELSHHPPGLLPGRLL